MKFPRAAAQRLGAVTVAADNAASAPAVIAVAREDLIHQRPHLVDHNAEGGHLQRTPIIMSAAAA